MIHIEAKSSVLIIDDDLTLLKMAGEILKSKYIVSYAKSGREALALLQTDYKPDIILLDVDMPGLSGFDTLIEFHKIEDIRDIPVVFLTGLNQPEFELKGLSFGAVDYITKPFVSKILLARLKVHIENGKQLRQLCSMKKNNLESRIDEANFEKMTANLTDTEKKIARLVALGYTNQEIGEMLSYSYNYVKKIVSVIYEKSHIKKRSELKKLYFAKSPNSNLNKKS